MTDRHISLVLATLLMAVCVAWISQSLKNATAPQEARIQTVTIEQPITEELPSNAASIRRESDGHYWTRANVDGSSIHFLVDTGASVVALTWNDAKRLRLKPENLDYTWIISTANGETKAASILVESIKVGNVEVRNVEAMILKEGALKNSLLGMSFLGQLYSYEFKGNTMIIRQ